MIPPPCYPPCYLDIKKMSSSNKRPEKAAHAMAGDIAKKPQYKKVFRQCVFCAKDTHKAKNCKEEMAASDRLKETAKVNGDFCKKCLCFGHKTGECRSTFGCNVPGCKSPDNHHELLHL